MFTSTRAFSGFSVSDIGAAQTFYSQTLGLTVSLNAMGMLDIDLPGGGSVLAYSKEDHVAAAYTMLNFEVADIDAAVDSLVASGVSIQQYGMPHQDEKGIARGKASNMGPDIAWFLDPAGNILSVLMN